MVQRGDTDAAGAGDATSFARALDELKRRGCTLLVVGSVSEAVYAKMSARMLGDGSNRRRLVVTPGAGLSRREVRLANVSRRTPEWTRIIQYETRARRSATAVGSGGSAVSSTDSPANADGGGRTGADARDPLAKVVDGGIAELGSEIATTIARFDGIASGLAPAELRVAFDCLPALLSEYGRETAFRFLHVLGNNVRSVGGMSHLWLPRDRDSETVRLFEPLFDATVELRLDGRELRQRWHFRDANLSSEWLSVE